MFLTTVRRRKFVVYGEMRKQSIRSTLKKIQPISRKEYFLENVFSLVSVSNCIVELFFFHS